MQQYNKINIIANLKIRLKISKENNHNLVNMNFNASDALLSSKKAIVIFDRF
jgi:hypothetical protein